VADDSWDTVPGDYDPAAEWKLRAAAIPVAIGLALAFHASPTGHQLQRTFLSMMVHELGHAVTAWLSGCWAIPTLWKTMWAPARAAWVTIAVLAGCGAIGYRAWLAERRVTVAAAGAVALAAIGLGWLTSAEHARAIISFGGDGGAMVLGTLLMISMFAGRDTQIYRGWLRWGFLVIGAAAFVDTFATWWTAQHDPSVIPFGELEGVGLSDPSVLSETYQWTDHQIIHRYVLLGELCLIALAAAYAWGVYAAYREAARAR
jgi:hypothetical protein